MGRGDRKQAIPHNQERNIIKSVKGRGGLTHGRGMHSSVRYAWTNTISHCASIHLAMSTVTGLNDCDHEHVEVSNARMKRDQADKSEKLLT